jgi:predicted peptidase
MMRTSILISALLLELQLGPVLAQNTMPKPIQTAEVLNKEIRKTIQLKYLLFLPRGYDPNPSRRWPMILFLHGIGERGQDPWKVKAHGPPKVAEQLADFPFIVVSPQCPAGEWWSNETLTTLLDEVIARHAVDADRVYLTGLSMGGFGAWSLALSSPNRFAAVAPICGGGNWHTVMALDPNRAAALKSLPFWVFHGDKDASIGLEESERMVNALRKFGCDIKFTVYPGVGHDSWTETYNNPELYQWFLKHSRARTR